MAALLFSAIQLNLAEQPTTESIMDLYTRQKFAQRQALPLEAKIRMTMNRIRQAYDHFDGDVYLAYSGGKDSSVLKHIIASMGLDIPSVFANTGLEMPEVLALVRSQPEVIQTKPVKNFKRVIEEDGFALISKRAARQIRTLRGGRDGRENTYDLYDKGITSSGHEAPSWKLANKWRYLINADIKISEACCNHLKKNPSQVYARETGRVGITAMMAEEGGERGSLTQCNNFDGNKPASHPMLFWRDADVWEYVEKYKVPIASVYYHRIVDSEGNQIAYTQEGQKFLDTLASLKPVGEFEDIGIYESASGERHYLVPPEKRTGCMFCMFGVHLEKGANRFQRMKLTHPRHWDTCINKLGLKKPLDLINVKYLPED